jgi:hypothetical protein
MVIVVSLAVSSASPFSQSQGSDPELEAGIRLAREGDYDAAILTLDRVSRRLASRSDATNELARAYTYLAIAYLGADQEGTAKATFLKALKVEPGLETSSKEFPPKIVSFFDDVRKENLAAQPVATAPISPSPTAPPAGPAAPSPKPEPAKPKGGSKKGVLIGGLGGLAAVGAAVAVGGGGGKSSPPPVTPSTPTPTSSPTTGNRAPTASITNVLPADRILVAVTSVTFTGAGMDPDNDPLTYAWDFGDGGATATGMVVSRSFNNAGSFDVKLTVNDGRGGSGTATRSVRVRSLSGTWNGRLGNSTFSAQINQNGAVVNGSWNDGGDVYTFRGSLADDRNITLNVESPGPQGCSRTYRGTVSDGLDEISTSGMSCVGVPLQLSFTRG